MKKKILVCLGISCCILRS